VAHNPLAIWGFCCDTIIYMDTQAEELEIAQTDSNGDRLVDEMWEGSAIDEEADIVLEDSYDDDSFEL